MGVVIDTIKYFPVKGLNAHRLPRTTLRTDRPIANDRRFALKRGEPTGANDHGRCRNKCHFLQLARHPKLAKLTSHYDDAQEVLTIYRRAHAVSRGQITNPLGRTLIEGFSPPTWATPCPAPQNKSTAATLVSVTKGRR